MKYRISRLEFWIIYSAPILTAIRALEQGSIEIALSAIVLCYVPLVILLQRLSRRTMIEQIREQSRSEMVNYQPDIQQVEKFYKRLRKGIKRTNELLTLVDAPYRIRLIKTWIRPEENPNRAIPTSITNPEVTLVPVSESSQPSLTNEENNGKGG